MVSLSQESLQKSKSPSVDSVSENWDAFDFGTFQNCTVSHSSSSCLDKRKLHNLYKNQAKLVNFNVPSSTSVNTMVNSSGSLSSSLAFGGQDMDTLSGPNCTGGILAFYLCLAASKMPSVQFGKKNQKREEQKRLISWKMQQSRR